MGAFEELYKKYYRQVYFYVLGLCRNEHIAEGITQESFFKALKAMDTFRGECKINVWITQIAKNTFYNYCREKKIDPESSLETVEAESSFEQKMLDREAAEQIHMVLHKMREPYRKFGIYCLCTVTASAAKRVLRRCWIIWRPVRNAEAFSRKSSRGFYWKNI